MELRSHCTPSLVSIEPEKNSDRSRSPHPESLERSIFREMFDGNQAVMLVIDPATGRIVEANPAACAFYGYDQEVMTRMSITDINMLPAEEIRRRMAAVEKKEERHFVMPHRVASGEIRDVEIFSSPVSLGGQTLLFSIIQDVSRRIKAEAARKEANDMLHHVFDSSPDLLLLIDRQLRIQLSNWKGRGFVPEEIRKTHPKCHQVFMDRETPCEPCLALEVFHNGLPRIYERYNPKPEVGHIEVHAYPIFGEDGAVVMVAEHVRNINERKRGEQEKAELQAHLHHIQKMESIGTLAGGLAHDFNNLLMAILGNISLIQNDLPPDSPVAKGLANISTYVRSATDLTKQLLGFAQGGKPDVQPTNLNALLARSTEMFGRAHKEIRISTDLSPDLKSVAIDRGQFDQVLLNILVNASQAMPAGGDLFINTLNTKLEEAYTAPYGLPPGAYVQVTITDTGIGMDEKTRRRVFEPFFTTKEMGMGTGLGLSSAYGIICNHAGIINVCSEPGQGSTFTIYLPAIRQAPAPMPPAESPLKSLGGLTILLVDDEEIILDTTSSMLSRLGAKVLLASNGSQALEIFADHTGHIDLVILDMIMPDMAGSETFDRLRAIDSSVRVVLASGYSISGQAARIMDRGCNGFIQKPFGLAELANKIHEVIAG